MTEAASSSGEAQVLQDYIGLREEFRDLTGRHPSVGMEMQDEGVLTTMDKLVGIEMKLKHGQLNSEDFYLVPLAELVADKALNWFLVRRREGAVESDRNSREMKVIKRRLEMAERTIDAQARREAVGEWRPRLYLVDSQLGANRAMDVLRELKRRFSSK